MHTMPEWARNMVREVSHRHAVPVREIFSPNKTRLVVAARREAIYRLKFEKPSLSAAKLGRWFGRDHSTILHAIVCYQELYDAPVLYHSRRHMPDYRRAA